jgi:hypothetical protein
MSVGVLGTPIGFNLTPSCIVQIDFYTLAIFLGYTYEVTIATLIATEDTYTGMRSFLNERADAVKRSLHVMVTNEG